MFFSVKRPLKILGKVYVPCVCYNAPKYLELTVESLKEEGKAVIHKEYVFFKNGAVEVTTKEVKKTTAKKVSTKAKEEVEIVEADKNTIFKEEGF